MNPEGTGSHGRKGRGWLWGLGLLAALAALVVAGIRPRQAAEASLVTATAGLATPAVAVIQPRRNHANRELVLPAAMQPWTDAPIYARTNGYLLHWYADIGTRVKAGQTLAELTTPEVDQQLVQARADLATAEANLRLAQLTAERYRSMLAQDAVAKQDADNAEGLLQARQAEVDSAAANVKRLTDLLAFDQVVAPFDGVITARNVDVGSLIDAGSGQRELFHLAATSTLRVFVNLPQEDSPAAKPGMTATLKLAQYPGRVFTARLLSTAGAIDPATRTLLTQFEADNKDGALLPGSYAELHLQLPGDGRGLLVPVGALLFRSAGPQVVVVTASGTAHLQPVTIGRDYGTEMEVLEGLDGSERVVTNPPDSVMEGEQLRVVAGGTAAAAAKP